MSTHPRSRHAAEAAEKAKAKAAASQATRIVAVPPTAHHILTEAGRIINQRGAQRDSAQGQERSMAATVAAFNAVEGTQLTERQGWAFMQILKMVRAASTARNGQHNPDDAMDGAAYAALGGEAAARHAAQQRDGGAQ